MKKVDNITIKKLLEQCKYIKWKNIDEKEYKKLKEKNND